MRGLPLIAQRPCRTSTSGRTFRKQSRSYKGGKAHDRERGRARQKRWVAFRARFASHLPFIDRSSFSTRETSRSRGRNCLATVSFLPFKVTRMQRGIDAGRCRMGGKRAAFYVVNLARVSSSATQLRRSAPQSVTCWLHVEPLNKRDRVAGRTVLKECP